MSSNKKIEQSSLKSFIIAPVACPSDQTVESPTLQILKPHTTKKRSLSPNIDESNTFSDKRVDENINMYDIGMYTNRLLKPHEIEEILQQIWKPENNSQFPVTICCTMSSCIVILGLMSVATVVGRLEPILYGSRNNTVLYNITTTTVGSIILSFENSSTSLGKGVMVVAIHWSRGGGSGGPNGNDGGGGNGSFVDIDDVPYGFLRNLQARYKQPVYAADLHRLLSDGRLRDTDDGNGALPQPCRPPVDHGLGSLLPLRSRYVVLFRGIVPPDWDPDPFVELAQLNYTFWNVDVYYLIVAINGFDPAVRRMVYGVWRDLSIHKIIVVTQTVIKILDPFADNAVDGRFLNVPPRSLRRIPSILHSRIGNLRRFPLRFIVNNRIPTVIAMWGGTYVGQDGAFATVLAAKMNATPVYISQPSANGKIYYGYRWTGGRAYGTFAGVIGGWADVSINGHFLKDYNCYLAELTRHITSDKVCLLTPKAGVIPPMMTVLMSFQREVWMMTAITCVLVTVIYFATAAAALDTHRPGPTGCDLGLEIYRMFIGAPTNRVFAYSCHRILTSFCLFFTLVILNAFQGSLVTFLSTPMHYPDVNTFTDLKQSGLPIRTSSISFKEILTGDPNLKSLAYRVEKWEKEEDIHNSDGQFAGFERVNVFNLEHFKDVLFVPNRTNTRVLHTMNECLISYFISYVVHRNSPYKRRINILLSWIDQAGLVLKWNSDVSKYIFNKYKPINPKDYDTSKVFSVRDLEIAFIVLSFGIILSITVFIIEIMMMYKAPKMRTPHPRHLPFLH